MTFESKGCRPTFATDIILKLLKRLLQLSFAKCNKAHISVNPYFIKFKAEYPLALRLNKTAFVARPIFAKDIILWQLTKSLDQVRVVVLNRARRKGAHVRPGPVFSVVQPARLRLAVLSADPLFSTWLTPSTILMQTPSSTNVQHLPFIFDVQICIRLQWSLLTNDNGFSYQGPGPTYR